jgi:hypothetical protein
LLTLIDGLVRNYEEIDCRDAYSPLTALAFSSFAEEKKDKCSLPDPHWLNVQALCCWKFYGQFSSIVYWS